MRSVTIKDAKAHLNELIDAASGGEQVILMRGSKHVAAIVPISEEELELVTSLTDAQAGRFWQRLADERRGRRSTAFGSAKAAVDHLSTVTAAAAAREQEPDYSTRAAGRPKRPARSTKSRTRR